MVRGENNSKLLLPENWWNRQTVDELEKKSQFPKIFLKREVSS
jgi:hypothetical protein